MTSEKDSVRPRLCDKSYYSITLPRQHESNWNGFVEYIVNTVCHYVNMLNSDFIGAGTKINHADHPRFLHQDLPPFVNTRVYNNNVHISIGLVSSSLDTHDVTDAHIAALGDAALDDEGEHRADSYAPG